jgi:predicted CXXCH cytochrome family protein
MTCHTTGYDPDAGTWDQTGVGCSVCHDPSITNHPIEPMASDRSAELCGECHTETFFEWQVSGHRQEDLDCVGCHDPHGTELKSYDASTLCATCHRTRASNFAHTAHSEQGLTCADCHLGPLAGDPGEGHAVRDHSFDVRLTTCNVCHAYQMHDPVEVHPEPNIPNTEEAFASAEMVAIRDEPGPFNPIGFAILAGLVGMAAGMILTPWLERWYRHLNRSNSEGARDE